MHERTTSRASTYRTNTTTTGTKKPISTASTTRRGTQLRSDRTSVTSVTNQKKLTDEQKETQRRIAARAATAMAQVRKRKPRSYMFWGDNRKAVIKRYPDGTQEILVPQTLTPEQEQYEFPPRSRLLKKLATSTAERQRLSSLQHTNTLAKSSLIVNPGFSTTSVIEPDQNALDEWFSGQRQTQQNKPSKKENAVLDWVSDVKRSNSLLKKSSARSSVISNNSKRPSLSAKPSIHNVDLKFQSDAGKRWTSGEQLQQTCDHLSPPKEDTRKHYVRRHRLLTDGNKPWIPRSPVPLVSPKVPRSTVSASPTTTKTGMVQLVQMFHKTLQDQQARAQQRMQQLEFLLNEERTKRHDIQKTQQATLSRLDTFMKKYQEQRTPPSPSLSIATSSSSVASIRQRTPKLEEWMDRITRLESSVEMESQSRQCLEQSVVDTVEKMDALKRSVSKQARDHATSRRHLSTRIDQALNNLSILTQQQRKR